VANMPGGDPYWQTAPGPGGYDWGTTPAGGQMSENATDAAYMRYLSGLGIGGGNSAYDQWLQNQYGRVMTGYKESTISNPNLTIQPYLNSLGSASDWYSRYMQNSTPRDRGVSYGSFAPQVRWMTR